jgi:hypothetical protein
MALLRRDAVAILLFAVAVVVMTYPLALQPATGLPNPGQDILTNLWQIWWLGEVIQGSHNANFSPLLFHPNGLDVTFQERHWAALGVWLPLRSLLGDIAGFNVSILLGLLVSAYTAYLLIHRLTDLPVAAWFGGAFYAFYPSHLTRLFRQPVSGSTQWIPLFMLALIAALDRIPPSPETRHKLPRSGASAMILAAAALSVNAYVGIKPWQQAVLMGALYVILTAATTARWKSAAFWLALGILGVCSLLLALPVLSPYLFAGSDLSAAIEQTSRGLGKKNADLLAFVKAAPELPIFMPRSLAKLKGVEFTQWFNGDSFYLGLTSISLVIVGLLDGARRERHRLVWLVIAAVFWILSLGTSLRVNGVIYDTFWLPYRLVAGNPFFRVIRAPFRLALGFSLPWAVLVGFGVAPLWRRANRHSWLARGLVGCLAILMLFELAEIPIPQIQPGVSPFYTQVLVDEQAGAIIDLPMDRQEAKFYMYLQTIHHRPIVEGAIARTPEGAYDYIDGNPLLKSWQTEQALACDFDVLQSIDDLHQDGFRYVVVHQRKLPGWLKGYFGSVEPAYRDELVTVYTLASLQAAPLCLGE